MKAILLLLAGIVITTQLQAQSNATVRLAIVSESSNAAVAADLITAEFSKHAKVQLLERAEIQKVIREQQLSLDNLDCLRLGRLLGADGLLALQSVTEGTQVYLNAQLVAVKPGVILTDERFAPPAQDALVWAANVVGHLDPLLPKLGVLPQDAIPLSVVNFHAGVRTEMGAEMERQILFLTVERLVQEKRLFVLERKRMQTLSEEKEMAGIEAEPFWNGKYVLDGTIDRDGFDPDVVKINARLIPPGGNPILIEASGSRTNCVEAVNHLAESVLDSLRIDTKTATWDTKDEADKYFKEAQWDSAWGLWPQAQAAVDSAWALGKMDLDCAELRVTVYMRALPEVIPANFGFYSNGKPGFHFIHLFEPPDPKNIDYAIRSLENYNDFCQTSPQGIPEDNSTWYYIGVENLALASGILQQFCLNPKTQTEVTDKLTQLRHLARATAEMVLKSPSVQKKYYPGDRSIAAINFGDVGRNYLTSWDSSAIKIPNIFECAVLWGCFWQERPEDTVALYRELMTSPQFFSNQSGFLFRDSYYPRLAAWNEDDAKHISDTWQQFMKDLAISTNYLLRLEAKAITCADARARAWVGKDTTIAGIDQEVNTNKEWKVARQGLLDFISSNYEAIVGTNHQLQWGMQTLLGNKSEYMDQFAAIQQRGLEKAKEIENAEAFEKQKHFLQNEQNHEPRGFDQMFFFGFKDYSREQAQELKPLLAEYKKHLSGPSARIGELQVGQVEASIDRILNPAPQPTAQGAMHDSNSGRSTNSSTIIGGPHFILAGGPPNRHVEPMTQADAPAPEPLVSSNVITIKDFYPLSTDDMPGDKQHEFAFIDHHWMEGKLLLDFRYNAWNYSFDNTGNWQSSADNVYVGMAIFDPASKRWTVAALPEPFSEPVGFASQQSVLWHGELYSSHTGKIRKYDFQKRTWEPAGFVMDGGWQFHNLDGRLFITDNNSIQEITENGRATKLLASIQRQPPVSSLDSQGALMNLTLFTDAKKSLCAAVHNKVFRWDGTDWQEIAKAPTSVPALVFEEGVLFQTANWNSPPAQMFRLDTGSNIVELCLRQQDRMGMNRPASATNDSPVPLWKLPTNVSFPNLSATIWQSDLILMTDHSEKKDILAEERGTRPDGTLEVSHIITGEKYLPKDGYDTALYFFSRGQTAAGKILLRFESAEGCPPMAGLGANAQPIIPQLGITKGWMLYTSNLLFCGRERVIGMGGFGPGSSEPPGFKAGIWAIPIPQVEAAVASLKRIQRTQDNATKEKQ